MLGKGEQKGVSAVTPFFFSFFFAFLALLELHRRATMMILERKIWPKRGVAANPPFLATFQSLHFVALSNNNNNNKMQKKRGRKGGVDYDTSFSCGFPKW